MKLIDADKLKEAFPARHNNKFVLIADVRAALNQAPEVDAVPVVRCGECKHMTADGRCREFADDKIRPSVSDFCICGERQEVNNEPKP